MKRIVKIAQGVGERVRNRMRSGSHRVMELRAPAVARYRNGRRNDCRKATNNYPIRLARLSRKRIAQEVDNGVKKAKKRIDQVRLEALKAELLESDDSGHSTLASFCLETAESAVVGGFQAGQSCRFSCRIECRARGKPRFAGQI